MFHKFQRGRKSVFNEKHTAAPKTATPVDKMTIDHDFILDDSRRKVRDKAEIVDILETARV